MHVIWWIIWIVLITMTFATVTPVPKHLVRSGERALDILRRRYAAGQVSTHEYERRKAVLEKDEPNSGSATRAH
jgi:putative membrane protein